MAAPEVHQFLPSLGYRDAVGNHTIGAADALAAAGFRGGIWAEDVHPEYRRRGKPYIDYGRHPSAKRGANLLLYQASTGSNGLVEFLLSRPERQLLYYHNITPSEFFEPYDPATAVVLDRGRGELKQMCGRITHAMANSHYSARELHELGVEHVDVFPPYLVSSRSEPSASHADWLRESKSGIDLLFVGRIVPNKGHMHLLRTLAALRAGAAAPPRLFVAGSWGPKHYMEALQKQRDRLGREGIVFTGSITESHLQAHYREADVFVCLSEHEGFGVPVLESMRVGLPVVAYDGGAVAETLGGSGVVVRTLDPLVVAEVVHRVATDCDLRTQIVDRQRERVAELERAPRDDVLIGCVRSVLN